MSDSKDKTIKRPPFKKHYRPIILRSDRRILTILVVYVIVLALIAWSMVYTFERALVSDTTVFVEKSPLKTTLKLIIQNNGDLNAVKHFYGERKRIKRLFLPEKDSDLYYSGEAPLSVVLNDLKCDYLSAEPFVNDSVYYSKLLLLIQENDFHNPFDNLEANQKYYIENIRTKSGDQYVELQSDISKIADELQHKNQLVEKYLNKSTLSFAISLIALIFSLITSVIQIIQNGKTVKTVDKIANKEKSESV